MQDRDSGSLRLVNLMRLLRDEGAYVVFLPSDLKHAGAYTQALQALGIEAWHAPAAGGIPAWLREHGPRFDSVIACRPSVTRQSQPAPPRPTLHARRVSDTLTQH